MTVDVRASVFCSLGVVIQASVADEALTAGQGLITCRGQVILDGIHTPPAGAEVNFGYSAHGRTARIPRTLRVLSSFADPFRNITTVQLGDLLVYKANVKPKTADKSETQDPEAPPETPDPEDPREDPGPEPQTYKWESYDYDTENQCYFPVENAPEWYDLTKDKATIQEQYGLVEESPEKKAPVLLSAAFIFNKCLAGLGIAGSGASLQNQYLEDEFDLSAGYVATIDKLLNSESLFGFLDESETLQVRSLDALGGYGAVVTSDSLIDIGPLGTGALPGDYVTVRYTRQQLNPDAALDGTPDDPTPDPEPDPEPEPDSEPEPEPGDEPPPSGQDLGMPYCEKDETWSETAPVCFVDENKNEVCLDVFSRSVTITCYDKYNYVTKRSTWKVSKRADMCGSIVQAAIASIDWDSLSDEVRAIRQWARGEVFTQTYETYYYETIKAPEPQKPLALLCSEKTVEPPASEVERRLVRQEVRRFEAADCFVSRLNMSGIDWSTYPLETIPKGALEVEKVVTTYHEPDQYSEKDITNALFGTSNSKTVVQRFVALGVTQRGQQQMAEQGIITEDSTDLDKVIAFGKELRNEDVEISLERRRIQPQKRPSDWERAKDRSTAPAKSGDKNADGSEQVTLEEKGNDSTESELSLELPLASDDGVVYTASDGYVFKGSNAAVMAMKYARTQNAILRGNRYGMALQLSADAMPAYPLDPVYINAKGATGGYLANGMSWSMNGDGVLGSIDAMYRGGVSYAS